MIVFSHSRRSSEHVRAEEELWSTRLEKHINARAGFKLYNQGKGLSTSYRICIKGKLNIKSPDSFSWEVVQRLPALPWRTRMRAASHSRGNHQRKGHFVKNVIFAVLRVRRGIFSPRSLELFHFKMKHCHMFLPPGRAPLWVYQIPTYIHNASGLHWEKHSKIIRPVMNARLFSCTRAAVCDPCLYLNPPDMKKNPVISGRCYRERLIVANCSKYQSRNQKFPVRFM